MGKRDCPGRDGPVSRDPYGRGIVECVGCGCRYHAPCAEFFREQQERCATCGQRPLTVRPVGGNRYVPQPDSPHSHTALPSPPHPAYENGTRPADRATEHTGWYRAGAVFALVAIFATWAIVHKAPNSSQFAASTTQPYAPQQATSTLPRPTLPESTASFEACMTRANSLLDKRNYIEALSEAETAVRLRPADAAAQALRDQILKIVSILDANDARSTPTSDISAGASESQKQIGTDDALRIARGYLENRQYQKALDQTEEILKTNPNHPEARQLRDQIVSIMQILNR